MTRMKKRIRHKVLERHPVKPALRRRGVTSDQAIELTSARGRKRCPYPLRRIGFKDPNAGRRCVLLTTSFKLSAATIAETCKSRWQVELFFKWIKQRLRVRSSVGTSRNAVLTQLWIAVCVHLPLSFLKFANRISWSLHEILRVLLWWVRESTQACIPLQPAHLQSFLILKHEQSHRPCLPVPELALKARTPHGAFRPNARAQLPFSRSKPNRHYSGSLRLVGPQRGLQPVQRVDGHGAA